jgi:hypothetical protein
VRLKLRRVKGRRHEVERLAGHCLPPGSTPVSDGLECFTAVAAAGCVHQPIRTASGRKAAAHPAFKWANTTLGNIKAALAGTYRAIPPIPRRVRIPLQRPLRYRRHDPAPRMVQRQNAPHALPLLKPAEDHV